MRLINAVRRSEESASFEIPSHAERSGLASGDFAKIGIEFDPTPEGCGGERLWVRVARNDGGSYVGTVGNALIATDRHGLNFGDRIAFEADHILDVWKAEENGEEK